MKEVRQITASRDIHSARYFSCSYTLIASVALDDLKSLSFEVFAVGVLLNTRHKGANHSWNTRALLVIQRLISWKEEKGKKCSH